MKNIIEKYGFTDYNVVSFQHLNRFDVRSQSRIPANAKSVLAFILPYYIQKSHNSNLSMYCSVQDYHTILSMRLKSICQDLENLYPNEAFAYFVDASPFDEVDLCVKAGLGVRGDNSLLLTKKYGSFVFIGEIVTSLELDTVLFEDTGCLHCNLCAKVCPGNAINNGKVNTHLCASHISQKKQDLTYEELTILKSANTVFGCDLCQKVCPYNKDISFCNNEFSENVIDYISLNNVAEIYKSRAFGFRGLKVLQRNLEIYNS